MRRPGRAPSPRVPPVATCAVPSMQDKRLHVRRHALKRKPATHRASRFFCAQKICISVSLGRSSFMGGGSLFPPCALRLLPFRRRAHPRFSLPPAAHTRPCALTLDPPGFVLLYGRARPATLPICADTLPVRARSRARARTTLSACAGYVSAECRGCRHACNIRALEKRILKTKFSKVIGIGLMLAALNCALNSALTCDVLRIVVNVYSQAGHS